MNKYIHREYKSHKSLIKLILFSSVRSDLMEDGANSTLSIAKVGKLDSGNYTCSIGPNEFYTITVHILHGKCLSNLSLSNWNAGFSLS